MSLFSAVLPDGEFRAAKCEMLDRLIAVGDGDAALLYLYVLRHGQQTDNKQAMRELRLSQEKFDQAAFTLTNLTITQPAAPLPDKSKTLPHYTIAELRTARTQDHRFRSVCSFSENLLSAPLNENLLRALYAVYEHIGLPAEVMIELLSYVQTERGKIIPRDLLHEAVIWSDRAIFTVAEAQKYLSTLQLNKPLRDAIYRILGVVGRAPTLAEKNLANFCTEKGFTEEAVQLAYDRMMRRNGGFSLNYLKKILQSWDAKNVHTASEITALEPERSNEVIPAAGTTEQNALSDWEQDWLDEINQRKTEYRKDLK